MHCNLLYKQKLQEKVVLIIFRYSIIIFTIQDRKVVLKVASCKKEILIMKNIHKDLDVVFMETIPIFLRRQRFVVSQMIHLH